MRCASFALILLLGLFSPALCNADEPAAVRTAHEDLQAALHPSGPAPNDAEVIGDLKAALKALKNLPGNRSDRRGQRRADAYIRAAIDEIQHGGSPNKARGDIYDADSVVRDIEN